MTLTILVPLDGSPLADRALPFASGLALAGSGRLVIAHVTPPLPVHGPTEYDPTAIVASLREQGLAAESHVVRAWPDDVPDVLLDVANEERADLLAMCTHGRGGLTRWVLGSVADQLVRRATLPVLLVPPHCSVDWTTRRPEQILVSLDGSRLAEEAIEPATRLARLLDAEVVLVRALSPTLHPRYDHGRVVLSSGDFAELDDAWHYLAERADGVRAMGQRASVWVVEGSPAAAITNAARSDDMDLIAMTTHGRGGLGRMLLGSIADGVVRRSTVPVLLIRSGRTRRSSHEHTVPRELTTTAGGGR
jgi:nucleotide-binding universal stress UspA family protein